MSNYNLYNLQEIIHTMTIAVDFDGTIVEHRYPAIGRELPFAIETLKNCVTNITG